MHAIFNKLKMVSAKASKIIHVFRKMLLLRSFFGVCSEAYPLPAAIRVIKVVELKSHWSSRGLASLIENLVGCKS